MFDSVIDFIKGGVGLFLTASVITIAVFLFASGRKLSTTTSDTMNLTAKAIEDSEYTKFLNTTVSGSDVLSFMRKHGDDKIQIHVQTLLPTGSIPPKTFGAAGESAADFKNLPSNSSFYINPAAEFTASVGRNANDAITSISFTQTKALNNSGDSTQVIGVDPGAGDLNTDTIKNRLDKLEQDLQSIITALANSSSSAATKQDVQDLLAEIQNLKTRVSDNSNSTQEVLTYLTQLDSQISTISEGYAGITSDLRTVLRLFEESAGSNQEISKKLEEIEAKLDNLPAGHSDGGSASSDFAQVFNKVKTALTQAKSTEAQLTSITQSLKSAAESLGLTDYIAQLEDTQEALKQSYTLLEAIASGLEVFE